MVIEMGCLCKRWSVWYNAVDDCYHHNLFILLPVTLEGIGDSRGKNMRDRHLNSWDRRVFF